MADLNDKNISSPSSIVGGDELYCADVVPVGGEYALVTKSIVDTAAVGQRHIDFLKNGSNTNMGVNGTTPVVFEFTALAGTDLKLDGLRIFGTDNGIKDENFMALNSALTNGCLLEIKSQDQTFSFPAFKRTQDFRNYFNFGGGLFELIIGSALDSFTATELLTDAPILLKQQGTYGTDDYVRMTIRDNISQVNELSMLIFGVEA